MPALSLKLNANVCRRAQVPPLPCAAVWEGLWCTGSSSEQSAPVRAGIPENLCVSLPQIQTHSHGGNTKAFFCRLHWQPQLPWVTGGRKSLVVVCVQARKVIFFPTSTPTQQVHVGRFHPWACRNCGGEEGELFSKGDGCWRRGIPIP